MDILPKLSPAQSLLLRTVARRADERVMPPDTLSGSARIKVLTTLLQRGWIESADGGHALSDAGYSVIGQQQPASQDDIQPMAAIDDLQLVEGILVLLGTKFASLVMALRRPQGAASLQLMLTTDWLRYRAPALDAAQEVPPECGAGAQQQRQTAVQGGVKTTVNTL